MGFLKNICVPIYTLFSPFFYRGFSGVKTTGEKVIEFTMGSLYTRLRMAHRRNLSLGTYPGSLRSAIIFLALIHIIEATIGLDLTLGLAEAIEILVLSLSSYHLSTFTSLSWAAFIIWLWLCTIRKFVLKQLFTYQGWIFERGKPSMKTKLFVGAVKFLTAFSSPVTRQLYGLQGMLPSLPVPPLNDTVQRYLDSMRPLMNDEEFKLLEKKGMEFVAGIGKKLQRYLVLKSWISTNYVSDWWEKYVYLMGRSSLLINSNYYSVDLIDQPERHQAARAALLIYETLAYRQSIEDNTMDPVIGQGVVPLCSWQYERFFNTCRIPGETTDSIQHVLHDTADYIVAYCQGKYYQLPLRHPTSTPLGRRGRPLSLAEWQAQFLRVIQLAENEKFVGDDNVGEKKLAALTAWDRVNWAKTRSKFFSTGVNKESLDLVEKAAFMVILDDDEYSTDVGEPDSKNLEKLSRSLLHGNGYNRWLDKSFNFIIGRKGRVGLNVEHTWADAALLSHLWECIFSATINFTNFDKSKKLINFPIETEPPSPIRLKWEFPPACIQAINTATKFAQSLIDDTEVKVLTFRHFGKDLMKKCRTSPDAFIQMALQLAYYRNTGRFDLTYEPSMTRLFKQGRTETVRTCSTDSCAWVRSMDSDLPREEKIRLFHKACERHQLNYTSAVIGKGFDRHLFGLLVVAKYLKVDTPFLVDALSEPWRLSTSPIPSCQTTLKGSKDLISVGGGFGTVAPDGYGISYVASNAGPDLIFFHVSSRRSCPSTDSRVMAKEIEKALLDASAIFSPVENNNSSCESNSSSSNSSSTNGSPAGDKRSGTLNNKKCS